MYTMTDDLERLLSNPRERDNYLATLRSVERKQRRRDFLARLLHPQQARAARR